jgi:hypothetical protein
MLVMTLLASVGFLQLMILNAGALFICVIVVRRTFTPRIRTRGRGRCHRKEVVVKKEKMLLLATMTG